jgi:hypothetical protein
MTWEWVIITMLGGLVCMLSYACWNLLKKTELLEEAINLYHAKTNVSIRLMRQFDSRQIFESDDEVGTVFKLLLESVDDLYEFVTEIRDGITQETEE